MILGSALGSEKRRNEREKKGTSRFFRKLLRTPAEMLLNMFDTGERTLKRKRKTLKNVHSSREHNNNNFLKSIGFLKAFLC